MGAVLALVERGGRPATSAAEGASGRSGPPRIAKVRFVAGVREPVTTIVGGVVLCGAEVLALGGGGGLEEAVALGVFANVAEPPGGGGKGKAGGARGRMGGGGGWGVKAGGEGVGSRKTTSPQTVDRTDLRNCFPTKMVTLILQSTTSTWAF